MKKKLLLCSVIACCCAFTFEKNIKGNNQLPSIDLNQVEAVASGESGVNNFNYTIWETESCHVYVGGAYATGKKVSCYSGNEHPVCVDCKL